MPFPHAETFGAFLMFFFDVLSYISFFIYLYHVMGVLGHLNTKLGHCKSGEIM